MAHDKNPQSTKLMANAGTTASGDPSSILERCVVTYMHCVMGPPADLNALPASSMVQVVAHAPSHVLVPGPFHDSDPNSAHLRTATSTAVKEVQPAEIWAIIPKAVQHGPNE